MTGNQQKNAHKQIFFNLSFDIVICLFLVTATLAVYAQTRNHSFLNYDDEHYVTKNPHVKAGITLEGIAWAFTATRSSNWHPLTWLSHMSDVQIFGMSSGMHHMTNVLFHIANSLLLFIIFKKMTGKSWQSGFVSALFALHPLHAESVAWVSERKDVLSTFFWMLTIWSYVWYAEHPGIKRYALIIIFFIMALMAKPMTVTLPFVLLLTDYWPLNRLTKLNAGTTDFHTNYLKTCSYHKFSAINLLLEKTPLFALAAASCIITVIAQAEAVSSVEALPLNIRIANAFVSYASYIGKMIWPCNLAFLYPHPRIVPWWHTIQACLFLGFISFLAIRLIKQRPCLAVGWFWYLGTLVPVIGLVQVGVQAMADRYTYVPLIGLSIMMAWGFKTENWKKENKDSGFRFQISGFRFQVSGFKPGKAFILSIVLAYLSILMAVAWLQVQSWTNSTTLYEHAVNVTTDNDVANYNLGNVLLIQGKQDRAIKHLTEALRLNPYHLRAYNDLGVALFYKGDSDKAVALFRKALQIDPDYADARNNLQKVLKVLEQEKNNK